jgi:hypothetical protein
MSPSSTFQSSGNSSKLVRLSRRPTVVKRASTSSGSAVSSTESRPSTNSAGHRRRNTLARRLPLPRQAVRQAGRPHERIRRRHKSLSDVNVHCYPRTLVRWRPRNARCLAAPAREQLSSPESLGQARTTRDRRTRHRVRIFPPRSGCCGR